MNHPIQAYLNDQPMLNDFPYAPLPHQGYEAGTS